MPATVSNVVMQDGVTPSLDDLVDANCRFSEQHNVLPDAFFDVLFVAMQMVLGIKQPEDEIFAIPEIRPNTCRLQDDENPGQVRFLFNTTPSEMLKYKTMLAMFLLVHEQADISFADNSALDALYLKVHNAFSTVAGLCCVSLPTQSLLNLLSSNVAQIALQRTQEQEYQSLVKRKPACTFFATYNQRPGGFAGPRPSPIK